MAFLLTSLFQACPHIFPYFFNAFIISIVSDLGIFSVLKCIILQTHMEGWINRECGISAVEDIMCCELWYIYILYPINYFILFCDTLFANFILWTFLFFIGMLTGVCILLILCSHILCQLFFRLSALICFILSWFFPMINRYIYIYILGLGGGNYNLWLHKCNSFDYSCGQLYTHLCLILPSVFKIMCQRLQ